MLYRAVIQNTMPKLAYIPYDYDELLPTTHQLRRVTHAFVTKAKRHINQHIRPIFHDRFTLYADYENYLRHELREWAEGILFDPRTVEHGIFQPSFLRTLMKRHLSGYEEWTIGKIAPIITYELMLRKFYDEA
jgi:asparagine synthase (glutamine-hydrolysing)